MSNLAQAVRRRCYFSLSYQTAQIAGLATIGELQQVAIGAKAISEQQVAALARYFNIRG